MSESPSKSGPNGREFKNAAYAHVADVGKALAHPTRLELLELLAQAPRTVEALAREVDQAVANTSHHLQTLKRARLVVARRAGQFVEYSLAGEDVATLLAALQRVAGEHLAALQNLTRDYFAARDGLEALDPTALLRRLREDDAVLVDVRPEHEYAAGHLPDALSIPLPELEQRLGELRRDRPIIAYCRGPYCALSADAARRLRQLGFDARRTDASVTTLRTASEVA
jgi:rhodanese-related sulfurtransferase/predicted transcriptional regulator